MTWFSHAVAGLALVAVAGSVAWPEDATLLRGEEAYARAMLCANGKPRHRGQIHPHITYGHLRDDPCCERDHFINLGLCVEAWCDVAAPNPRLPPTGATGSNPGNVWYQPYPDWKIWNVRERQLERDYCAGRIERMEAWQILIDGKN